MAKKDNRSMKVYGQSGYNYKTTPTIMLKGQWLKEMGFEIGKYVQVKCEDGKLIITLDEIKGKMVEAETLFMERKTKRLQKEFEHEKERLHAQFVAEEKEGYNV